MEYSTFFKLVCGTGMVIVLAACTTPKPVVPPCVPVEDPVSTSPLADSITDSDITSTIPYKRTFAEGLDLFHKGKYPAAIKKFQSQTIARSWPDLRVRALKYIAFSYCLTNKLEQCKKAFEDALQIDPKFDLKPSERDHPIWGPVFQQVRPEHPSETASDTQVNNGATPCTDTQEQATQPADASSAANPASSGNKQATQPADVSSAANPALSGNKSEQSSTVAPSDGSASMNPP